MYQTVFFFPKEVSKCCTITCVYVKDLNYKPKVVNQKSLEPGSWSQDLAYDRKKQRVRAVRVVHHLEENKIVTQKTIYCRTSSYPILKCPSQKSKKEERGFRSEETNKRTPHKKDVPSSPDGSGITQAPCPWHQSWSGKWLLPHKTLYRSCRKQPATCCVQLGCTTGETTS